MDEREYDQRVHSHAPNGCRQMAINRIVRDIADAESWERLTLLTQRRRRRSGDDAA